MVWYGMVWHGMVVWYSMVWHSMVRYGMVRYGMVEFYGGLSETSLAYMHGAEEPTKEKKRL